MQIFEKRWVTPELFHSFVQGLEYITGGIKGHYCGGGKDNKVLREILERKKIGWRIFPMPDVKYPEGRLTLSMKEIGDAADESEAAWIRDSERICKGLFETPD